MPVSEVVILYVIALMMASALSCLAIVLPRPDSETDGHKFSGRQSPHLK